MSRSLVAGFVGVAVVLVWCAALGGVEGGVVLRGANDVDRTHVKHVHLVFMTHLDIGYTNTAAKVCELYFQSHFPNAIKTAQAMRARGGKETYVFTSHPWIILEYLTGEAGCTDYRPSAGELDEFKAAITRGDITWHANAFSMLVPMVPPVVMEYSLTMSKRLDSMFGKEAKVTAKQEDTMGFSVSTIPIMAKAGVSALHMGVNSNCQGPDVPPAFVWRHSATNTEILAMLFNKQGPLTPCSSPYCTYGGDVVLAGFDHALVFDFQPDNTSPATVDEVLDMYARARAAYPNAEVLTSSIDGFVAELQTFRAHLPVITSEIGDSWLYGVAGDPVKVAGIRAVSQWLEAGEADGLDRGEVQRYMSRLMKVPEHNWGLSTGVYFTQEHYNGFSSNGEFHAVRGQPDFQAMEQEWKAQRNYLRPLSSAGPLAKAVEAVLSQLTPSKPVLSGAAGLVPVDVAQGVPHAETRRFTVGFSAKTGAIDRLVDKQTGRAWAAQGDSYLGAVVYQTFSIAAFDRFTDQFNPGCYHCGDFSKPGMRNTPNVVDSVTTASLAALSWRTDAAGAVVGAVTRLALPDHLVSEYGGAAEYYVEYDLSGDHISATLQWFNKTATRLGEATWFSFNPAGIAEPKGWTIDVQGYPIDPLDVVSHGTRNVHASSGDVTYHEAGRPVLTLRAVDSTLVGPGGFNLINFDNTQPDTSRGMHFNVHNNLWGTAFPQWYDADGKFRFELHV